MDYEQRRNQNVMNMLFSYGPKEDDMAASHGYIFLGAAFDDNGKEVHVFELMSLSEFQNGRVSKKGTFAVGDIVSHTSGRICNGKYGEIIIDWNGELMVLDNEGSPHIPRASLCSL